MTTVTEVENALEKFSPEQMQEVAAWIDTRLLPEETPAMLAAIDEGIRSLEDKGARVYTYDEMKQKVRQWAGTSH